MILISSICIDKLFGSSLQDQLQLCKPSPMAPTKLSVRSNPKSKVPRQIARLMQDPKKAARTAPKAARTAAKIKATEDKVKKKASHTNPNISRNCSKLYKRSRRFSGSHTPSQKHEKKQITWILFSSDF